MSLWKSSLQVRAARAAHEVNRTFCEAIGDESQVAWHAAPDWQKKSAIDGVRHIQAHPDAPASTSHDNWLAEKRRDGWKHGPVKDPVKKEHPCMVPFDELPDWQMAKDILFCATVRGVLAHALEPEPELESK